MPLIEVVNSSVTLKTTVFPLKDGHSLLGREKGCEVEIPDPRISNRHALITVAGERVEFMDQGSTNGIYLNGVKTTKGRWPIGKSLVMGGTIFLLKGNPAHAGTSVVESSLFGLTDSGIEFDIQHERKIRPTFPDAAGRPEPPVMDSANSAKHLQIVKQMVKSVQAVFSEKELLKRIMTLLFKAIQCDTGYILLTDSADPGTVQAHVAYELGRPKLNLDEKLYSRTLVNGAIQNKSGFVISFGENAAQNPSLSVVQLHIKSALCCPIHSGGKVFGVVYLDNKISGAKFTKDDLDLTMNVADIAGVAIENLHLYKKLETESLVRDHLKRYLSPNVADMIVAEGGAGDMQLQSKKTAVTVLFADIRGFTSLSETLAPLEVTRLLNAYFTEMSIIVFANGGTLDKFIGDCMMVLFNTPLPLADHECAAVKTALQMRRRLRQVASEWRSRGIPDFQVGIGINCGDVVAGTMGTDSRMEYTAIGDAVNIASRICDIAKPNQILITEDVHEKVKTRFRAVMLGATPLKGKSQPVLVHEVLDDLVHRSPS